MAYKVRIDFDDGSEEILDETFRTEDEAEEAAEQWSSDYSQGGDYLEEAGEERCESVITGWEIYKA